MLKPMKKSLPSRRFLTATAAVALGWYALAQTDGVARMEVTLLDYNGSGAKHYTVAWVTTESGGFIKSLRKQGPSSWTSKEWNDHCRAWNTARAGSTALDGYTSATASTYSGTNNPVICLWDGRDAAGQLVPDGRYKFWVQYAENSGQGPYTTNGLVWVKGPAAAATTYPDPGANFVNLRVIWEPAAPTLVAPTITSASLRPTATVGVSYAFTCVATGSPPPTFTAQGLPPGLSISSSGLILGIPTSAGVFPGQITAANGVAPEAIQPFSITVIVVPTTVTARQQAGNLVLTGNGPPEGRYTVIASPEPGSPFTTWSVLGAGSFEADGSFTFTNAIRTDTPSLFHTLRVP